jgi:hypothetical protein
MLVMHNPEITGKGSAGGLQFAGFFALSALPAIPGHVTNLRQDLDSTRWLIDHQLNPLA